MKNVKLRNSINFKFLILNSRRAGFTLIELIIVLFLISLMFGMSAVYFANRLPSSRFNSLVREISATVRHARSLARISGERKTLTIDLDSGKYRIEGHDEKGVPSNIIIKIKDPLSGEINKGTYRFFFNAAGDIKGGTIVLQYKKRTVDIEMDPIVGAVVVK